MNIGQVLIEMESRGLIPASVRSAGVRNGASWDTMVFISGDPKPTLTEAQAIWDEIKAPFEEEDSIKSAREQLSQGAVTSKRAWTVIKGFNDDLEDIFQQSRSLGRLQAFNAAYDAWRSRFDGLPNEFKSRVIGFTYLFTNPSLGFTFNEPLVLTNDYKAEFMVHIREFLQYITTRALI